MDEHENLPDGEELTFDETEALGLDGTGRTTDDKRWTVSDLDPYRRGYLAALRGEPCRP